MTPHPPRFVARDLAEPGSLTRELFEGGPARSLLPEGSLDALGDPSPPSGPSRLPPERIRGGSPESREHLRAALAGDGVLVTTGQQPQLFLGPLLVLYKAVTAQTIAGALRASGVRAAPLFWVASDDHDWDEVGTTRLLDTGNDLHTLSLEPPDGREGRAAGLSPLPKRVEDRIDELSQLLPSSEFIDDYLELIRDEYRPGRTLGEAFGGTLAGVLGEAGIPWLDAGDSEVRRAAAPLYRRVVEEADAVRAALRRATRRVAESGHEPQVTTGEGAVPLFLDRPEGRTRLYADDDDGFRLGRAGPRLDRDEVLAELDRHPERFSPDVALRPLLASWLLPTGMTVLGPSEFAYWTQLPDLFEWADVPFPRLRPRDSWTVVEEKVGKVLEKLDVGVDGFDDGGARLAERVRERGTPDRVSEALADARDAVGEAMAAVEDAVGRELPGIRSAVGAARHGAFGVLDELESAVTERVEERHEVLLGQIEKAAAHLRPDRRPQERVLSPFYYLARYGHAFVEELRQASREARGAVSDVADGD